MKKLIGILLLAAVTITGLGCRREKIVHEGKTIASTIYEAETDKSIWKVSNFPLEIMDTLGFILSVDNIRKDTALVSKLIKLEISPIYFPLEYNQEKHYYYRYLKISSDQKDLLVFEENDDCYSHYIDGHIITYQNDSKNKK